MTRADISAGLGLCRANRWNQLEDDWRTFLESPRGGGVVATKTGAVVGTVTFIRYDHLSWIAMMLVEQQERGAGIGSQLLREALGALKNEPCVGLDATPAGEPMYRRHGFVEGYGLARMKAAIESRCFQTTAERVRLMNVGDLPHVFERDRKAFGADRAMLLASLYTRAPQCAWIARNDDGVLGYCFGRPGYLYNQLGPIVADREETARELTARCLREHDGKPFVIDAPRHAPEWLAWLRSVGFIEERPLLRMYLGRHEPRGVPSSHFGIAGPEFG
ncbi:MAG: GNAT family N-acetyltransferase [Acidobacteriota bacterium]|nr:GNAT family N-acetyltransferase [Acidobacteriota bacterium]